MMPHKREILIGVNVFRASRVGTLVANDTWAILLSPITSSGYKCIIRLPCAFGFCPENNVYLTFLKKSATAGARHYLVFGGIAHAGDVLAIR